MPCLELQNVRRVALDAYVCLSAGWSQTPNCLLGSLEQNRVFGRLTRSDRILRVTKGIRFLDQERGQLFERAGHPQDQRRSLVGPLATLLHRSVLLRTVSLALLVPAGGTTTHE